MNSTWKGSERRKSLRDQAEAMLGDIKAPETTGNPAEVMMHELMVHKVELEMQNEELRQAYSSLEEARDRYLDLYEFAPVGYVTLSREGLINEINLTGTVLLGIDRTKLLKRRFSQFIAPQDKDRWYRLFLSMMKNPKADAQDIGLELNHAGGTSIHAHLNCLPKMTSDAPTTVRVAITDITQQHRASEQIEHLAFFDPLTNLPNRQLLKDRLHQALAASARNKQYGALLFIDLDNFKTLNDTLGHNIGDLLLQEVGRRLLSRMRENDTAARLGGDEFVVMLENLSANPENAAVHAQDVGSKILAALNEPYLLEGHDYRCSSSIGATLFYEHAVAEDDLLKHVDIAMYQAKHNGRNTLCFFDQAMQVVVTGRAGLEADLRLALEQNQFILYYQMQKNHDGQTLGAEALLRWQHPVRGLVLPMEFIPLAEETGQILAIGQWVMENACAQLKRWENNPHTQSLHLAINVSALQFHQPDFVEQVQAVLTKTAIDPNRFKIELTESIAIKNIGDTISKMHALKNIGVSFAMDDFGTGYSSLAYLTQLPLDQIKIDRSFVRNIGEKDSDALIVQTIIGIANNLCIKVIAEGVETELQRAFLEQHGCLQYQGYLFSKPVPVEEFENLIKALG
ncbi:MAG: EAL domain-containing protein [Methylococcales bacterium]|nr:EAL domain-containing protein [Methylococcaceae bacterium]